MPSDVTVIEQCVRVVLVDDRPQRRRIMREVLLAGGVPSDDIAEADDAAGVVATGGTDPNVVVIERQTPMPADLAAITLLRERFPLLRIEIASFRTDDATKRLELEAGADGHLDKPVRTADVRRILEEGRARVPAGPVAFAEAGATPPDRPAAWVDCPAAAGVAHPPEPMPSHLLPPPVPASAVLDHIEAGADLIVPLANGEPPSLLDALEAGVDRLQGVRVHQMHALQERAYIRGEFGDRLRHVSYFLSAATRPSYWAGEVELVPNHFSEVPALLHRNTRCSLVLARVAPPDRHGYFSLGTNADYTASLIGRAPFFVEADPNMPRTFGENQLHHSQVLGWCEASQPLTEVEAPSVTDADRRIAQSVAERVGVGATIQVGIGAIADAVLEALRGHRDLGVHTELVSDGIVDLVESGAVNGTRKHLRRNKVVGTFALGTRRLYEWLDENAAVELLPVEWVNDPRVIAQERRFVSVNATTEVDLYGQCASETIAGRYWSSSGGQADFARGAMYAEEGQAFVVLRSTARDGRSRIRVQLSPGSVVTTLKNTVDHIVTEWGVAELRGKSLAQRARALIAIGHPDHREELERGAYEAGLLGRRPV